MRRCLGIQPLVCIHSEVHQGCIQLHVSGVKCHFAVAGWCVCVCVVVVVRCVRVLCVCVCVFVSFTPPPSSLLSRPSSLHPLTQEVRTPSVSPPLSRQTQGHLQ